MTSDNSELGPETSGQMRPVGGGALSQAEQVELAPLSEAPIRVEVRLGSARLALGELTKLRPGMVVTLERRVGEPAEVVVGDKVIALGQIVLVGDELGVRLTELQGKTGTV